MPGAKKKKIRQAQSTMEFTFSMVITILLLMGMIQVMIWAGKDLAMRRQAHERILTDDRIGYEQVTPDFFYSAPVSATWASNIYGN